MNINYIFFMLSDVELFPAIDNYFEKEVVFNSKKNVANERESNAKLVKDIRDVKLQVFNPALSLKLFQVLHPHKEIPMKCFTVLIKNCLLDWFTFYFR